MGKQASKQIFKLASKQVREASEIKNVPKSGKSPKGGAESAQEIIMSTIQNVDLMTRGGEAIFSFFSQM